MVAISGGQFVRDHLTAVVRGDCLLDQADSVELEERKSSRRTICTKEENMTSGANEEDKPRQQ